MSTQAILQALKTRNNDTLDAYRRDLQKMRTGRANIGILDGIHVDYYGTATPLNQVAQLSAPEARLIIIKPYERKLLGDIERAILASDLGLTPNNDGEIIRLNLPQLTEERRKDLVKQARKHGEDYKVSMRNHRRDAIEEMKKLEKDKLISEDDRKRGEEQVQKLTDDAVKSVEQIFTAKEKELLEV